MQNEYDHFIQVLKSFGSAKWLNGYFDTLKRLLTALNIQNEDERLAMNVTKDLQLNTNIGQRWISRPYGYNLVGLILPLKAKEKTLRCSLQGYFKRMKMPEAKWVLYDLKPGAALPPLLYTAWQQTCTTELKRTVKSGFRKYHSSLFYDTVVHDELRNEILEEAFAKTKQQVI